MAMLSVVLLLGCAHGVPAEPSARVDPFSTLQQRLIRDGFDRSRVEVIYSRPEVSFDQQGIAAYAAHREATLNYDQFLTPSSIDLAIDYINTHMSVLQEAQKLYGVEGEVVAAILLVESRLGTYIGKRRVFNTLSSLAVLDEAAKRDMLWHTYVKETVSESKEEFDRWALRKSAWAFGELKAYLKYVNTHNVDPLSMRGSYAGALGFA